MAASTLMTMLRLAHGVLEFLVKQREEEVLAFAHGHTTLAFISASQPVETSAPPPSRPMESSARPPETVPLPAVNPAPAKRSSGRTKPTIDEQKAAETAEALRRCETESDGLGHLNRVAKNNEDRKLIAQALNIEGAGGLSKAKLIEHILRHAIGARRTFDGLSSW